MTPGVCKALHLSPPPPKAKATPLRGTGLRWSLRSTSSRPGTHPRPCAPAVLSVHSLCPAPGPHPCSLSPSLWLPGSPPPGAGLKLRLSGSWPAPLLRPDEELLPSRTSACSGHGQARTRLPHWRRWVPVLQPDLGPRSRH